MNINKILTSQYQDLSQEEIANLQHTLGPVIGGGLEGYWRPSVSELGNITWTWSNASTATTPAGMNIKGPSGFTPQFQIDQSTAEWQVTYDGTNWTPLGIIASGAQGPQGASGTNGKDGEDGKDGTSIYLKSVTDAQGGKQVTLGWGTSDTSAFVIPSGAAGTPGTNGVSPTVALTPIQDQQYPQGGWNVTITDAEHQSGQTFQIFNGIDGQGATVDLVEGNGIQITHQSGTTDYTIGVSADYALKTDVEAASANALSAAESWTNLQNFATSAGLDTNKQYAMTTNGWSDFVIPSTSGYLPLSGGTVSGKTTISASDFFALEIQRSGQTGTGTIGINGANGMSLKITDGNNNTQLNIAPNATMDKRFSIGDSPYSPAAYLIPAVTATTTAGLTNDGILHIILES